MEKPVDGFVGYRKYEPVRTVFRGYGRSIPMRRGKLSDRLLFCRHRYKTGTDTDMGYGKAG
jgi:hypothetical protein